MSNKQKCWIDIYQEDFLNAFKDFKDALSSLQPNQKTCSLQELTSISQAYLQLFEKTIYLFKYYFNHNTLLLLEDTRLIVIYTLKCDILQNGILFYEIYLAMKKIKSSNLTIPKKYLGNKYIDIFLQINEFFETQRKEEHHNAFFY